MNAPNTKDYPWVYCPSWNIIFGTSPKVGSKSLHEAIRDGNKTCWTPTENDWIMAPTHVWLVRDPVSRFVALWKDKCRDAQPLWVDGDDNPIKDMDPAELMTFIATTDIKDNHWALQSTLCGRRATEVVPLEKFSKWWDERGFPKMDKLGVTERTEDLEDWLIASIEDHYERDVRLYREAL